MLEKKVLLFRPSEAGDDHTGVTGPPTRPAEATFHFSHFHLRILPVLLGPDRTVLLMDERNPA